jgi:hypothetical protein
MLLVNGLQMARNRRVHWHSSPLLVWAMCWKVHMQNKCKEHLPMYCQMIAAMLLFCLIKLQQLKSTVDGNSRPSVHVQKATAPKMCMRMWHQFPSVHVQGGHILMREP